MRSRHILALVLFSACGYHAGSFEHPLADFDGPRRTVGCIDVSIAPYADSSTQGPAAAYTLGNRCDAPVLVDLRVAARVRYADGSSVKVRARDPGGEIHKVYLEARSVGREYIEYAVPADAPADPEELCLDVAKLDAAAPRRDPSIVCIPDLRSTKLAEVN